MDSVFTISLCYYFVCGAILGFGYELLRLLRVCIRHNSFAVGVEDLFYLSLCGFVLFGLSVQLGGIFRFMYLVSAFLGATAYFLTVGRLVKAVYSSLIKVLKRILRFAYKKIVPPLSKTFVAIIHKSKLPFVKIHEFIIGKIKNRKIRLNIHTKMVYNEKNTIGGSDHGARSVAIKAKVKKI